MKNLILLIVSVFVIFLNTGCQTTPTQSGAMWGGVIGGVAGQIIGHDTESTLLGAGAGALGGALLNNYVDNQRQRLYQQGAFDGYSPRGYSQPMNTGGRPVSLSGYYNPPNTGNNYSSAHYNTYETHSVATVNGQAVYSQDDVYVMERINNDARRQQELDHRQAMDRARQQQHELQQYSRLARDISYTVRNLGNSRNFF
ncbi:MAG: hypothetical protein COV57_01460 [Candidatus Liptonbacteria bacterium CG11_big_fil_rev_8_21_14_0_20_35_14]|uniref:YMGG-like Gly-zipper domain-containing protein n=1 Tax=Candidatus Liptonbacteria bacterium CG11_big_fil_rev_8_21_14_0_20_35_14 TaxID=1974634 RepID=A0A2H0N7Y5_9BACT|nr:MAG: hypothetical protein COV57_01460 [Candidatus Liptonbacteria bacterium CG11_big_fil_rev_8_21_14_0_20_35_14]